jgi:hypothetical protein
MNIFDIRKRYYPYIAGYIILLLGIGFYFSKYEGVIATNIFASLFFLILNVVFNAITVPFVIDFIKNKTKNKFFKKGSQLKIEDSEVLTTIEGLYVFMIPIITFLILSMFPSPSYKDIKILSNGENQLYCIKEKNKDNYTIELKTEVGIVSISGFSYNEIKEIDKKVIQIRLLSYKDKIVTELSKNKRDNEIRIEFIDKEEVKKKKEFLKKHSCFKS